MANKIDDNSMEVEKTEPSITKKVRYSYDFLLSQKIAIQAQKDREITQRDRELLEINTLLTEAKTLGLKTLAEIEAAKPKPVII